MDVFAPLLSSGDLTLLMAAAALAGAVRGFSGFGSGLVFMPFAALVVSPAQAIAILALMDTIGTLPNVPPAWRQGQPRDLRWLFVGMLPGLVAGFALLLLASPESLRWGMSLLSLATVAALIAGWQWRGPQGIGISTGTGFLAGLMGGAVGLPGPPVVLSYLARPLGLAQIRANLTLFMVIADGCLLTALAITGQLSWQLAGVSLVLLIPFSLANALGSALFRPDKARTYKALSWTLIAVSALVGLPLWKA